MAPSVWALTPRTRFCQAGRRRSSLKFVEDSSFIRILIVNNYAHVTGGADRHCFGITAGLRERGHDVRWLSTRSAENVEHHGRFVSPTVTSGNRDYLSVRARLRVASRALWNPEAARAMQELVDDFKPDVVHVHKSYVQLSVAPAVVASRSSLPVVQTVHDYEFLSASPFDATGGRWDHEESRFSYRALNSATLLPRIRLHRPRVTKWIAVSEAVADIYRKVGKVECTVIPNFAEEGHRPVPQLSDRSGFLYLGRLSREKGIDHVLAAARVLPDKVFVFAGDGPLKEDVVGAAARMPNVAYEGFVEREQAVQLVRSSVASLMPSTWEEPGPLACLEAMAEGTPVICFPSGGLAEYVRDSSAGIVCARPEVSDLVGAVEDVSEPEAWGKFSRGGLAGSEQRHSLGSYLDPLEAVYRSAMPDS